MVCLPRVHGKNIAHNREMIDKTDKYCIYKQHYPIDKERKDKLTSLPGRLFPDKMANGLRQQ